MNSQVSTDTAPAEVFVSYSSKDVARVLPLVRQLEEAGIAVWRDHDRLVGGDYYGAEIAKATEQCTVMLLACSKAAFASDNVAQEVKLVWEFGHRRILPILLERDLNVPFEFRYCLVGRQWVEICDNPPEQWLPILLAALGKMGVLPRRKVEEPVTLPPAEEPKPVPAAPPPSGPQPVQAVAEAPTQGESWWAKDAGQAAPSTAAPAVEQTAPPVTGVRRFQFRAGDRPIPGVDLELVEPLGTGGFGEVWKAVNPMVANMQPVALKFCLDPEAQELLRHEAATVAQVLRHGQRHEGIVTLLHTYLSATPPALEYEFISGGTLAEYVQAAAPGIGSLPLSAVHKIIRRLIEIVGYFHKADPPIVHRDLKPANVLIERRGPRTNLRIADFGIGGVAAIRLIAQTTSSTKEENVQAMLKGAHTPLYASPQQIAGKRPDPRDDVHALGVIWYQLLTGDLTTGAPSGQKWTEPLKKRGLRPELVDLLSLCFESRAEDRPADAAVLLAELAKREPARPAPVQKPGQPPKAATDSALILDVLPAEPLAKPAAGTRSGGTTRGPYGSGANQTMPIYPRLDGDGNTQLKCDCGKIVTLPSAAAGKSYGCPVCGSAITVPEWWTTPEPTKGTKAEAGTEPSNAPAALKWDKLFEDRKAQAPQRKKSGGWLGRWFGPPSASAGTRTRPQRASALKRIVLIVVLVIVALFVVTFLIAFSGSNVMRK